MGAVQVKAKTQEIARARGAVDAECKACLQFPCGVKSRVVDGKDAEDVSPALHGEFHIAVSLPVGGNEADVDALRRYFVHLLDALLEGAQVQNVSLTYGKGIPPRDVRAALGILHLAHVSDPEVEDEMSAPEVLLRQCNARGDIAARQQLLIEFAQQRVDSAQIQLSAFVLFCDAREEVPSIGGISQCDFVDEKGLPVRCCLCRLCLYVSRGQMYGRFPASGFPFVLLSTCLVQLFLPAAVLRRGMNMTCCSGQRECTKYSATDLTIHTCTSQFPLSSFLLYNNTKHCAIR